MERLKDKVEIARRELRTAYHANEMRRRLFYRVPIEERHRITDSVRNAEKDIEQLTKEAVRLEKSIRQLLADNGVLNPFEVTQKISDLVEQLERTVDQISGSHHGTAQPFEFPVYTQADLPAPQFSSIVPVMLLAYLGICRLKDKLAARKKK